MVFAFAGDSTMTRFFFPVLARADDLTGARFRLLGVLAFGGESTATRSFFFRAATAGSSNSTAPTRSMGGLAVAVVLPCVLATITILGVLTHSPILHRL